LAEQFSRFGEIESITVYSARNYAFINFRKEEDAVIAKRSLQGLVLSGLPLRIEFAKGVSVELLAFTSMYFHYFSPVG
jgi:RNA recognition motif-containing protein